MACWPFDGVLCGNCLSIATLGVIVLTLLAYYVRRCLTYWTRLGVYQLPPKFPMGNLTKALTLQQNIGENIKDLYNSTNEPYCGIYFTLKPALLLRDPEFVNKVMVSDFQHFRDRGKATNEEYDPLSGHLFSLTGDKWKNLRSKLTPTFTSGKLKMMFQTLLDCGNTLDKYIDNLAKDDQVFEVRDVMARYTTDIIASVAFGIEVDSINEPDVVFRDMGRKVFAPTFKNGLRNAFLMFLPKLIEIFKMKVVENDVEEFMLRIVRETIEYREMNNVQRKDFMQLLIQLRNTGKVDFDGNLEVKTSEKTLTMNEITAQALIFYLAGFETSSTTMSFCLYELSKNPEIQNLVRAEIKEVMSKHDNKLTYDCIMEMKYLESCIDETLRKYPPLPFLHRICTKPIQLAGTNFTIKKDMLVVVPLLALQRDPKYFPSPMTFNPDRFYKDEANIKQSVYMPFGDGPRNCIGLRMGKMMTKVGLCIMLNKYKYELGGNTKTELEMQKKNVILTPVGGLNLKISYI